MIRQRSETEEGTGKRPKLDRSSSSSDGSDGTGSEMETETELSNPTKGKNMPKKQDGQ